MKQYAEKQKRTLIISIFIFLLLAVGIIAVGYKSYRKFELQSRAQAESRIATITKSKINGLAAWHEDLFDDANFIYKNPAFSNLAGRYLKNPQDVEAKKYIHGWLNIYQTHDQFDQIILLDAQGEMLLFIPDDISSPASAVKQKIPEALRSEQITIIDFYRDEYDQRVYLAILIPILDEQQSQHVIGFLALRVNPRSYLYPYINEQALEGAATESFLVRSAGSDVLFLNELRFQPDAALTLRVPLEKMENLAVKAALGQMGIVEGLDYRGVPTIGVAQAVPDSPWFLVTRMDIIEVYAPTREYFWGTIIVAGTIILYSGLGLVLIWRQQLLKFYQAEIRTAEILRESEERFRSAFQYSAIGMALVSLEGKWLRVNSRLSAILGYSEDELLTKTFQDITHPDDLKVDLDYVRQMLDGEIETYTLEKRYLHKEGNIIWALVAKALIRDSTGAPLYFISQIEDITERKQAEENLLKQQYYLEKAQEIGSMGTWEFDLLADKLIWTEQNYRIFGIPMDAPLSYAMFLERIHPDDLQHMNAEWEAALRGKAYDVEHRIIVDGNIKWVREKGNVEFNKNGIPMRAIGFAQDITVRRYIEEELRLLTQELDIKVHARTEELQKVNQTLLQEKQRAELLVEDIKENREQLRALSQQMVDLQEAQIKNLARELHDSVGQNLTAININLSLLQQLMPENYPEDIKSRLADTSQIVEETVVRMRNVMSDFLPPMLESYGLSPALSWYGEQFTKRTEIPVNVNDYRLDAVRLPPQSEVGLFRIVQEALNNTAKHAYATQVDIELKDGGNELLMTIADNGVGFDTQVVFAKPAHWGFAIMRERARALDASFDIKSAPGKGTKILLRIAR
jgi:PAS domain S-box-containing protein